MGQPLQSCGHRVRYLMTTDYNWLNQDSPLEIDRVPVPDLANPVSVVIRFLRNKGMARIRAVFTANPPKLLLLTNLNPFIDRIMVRIAKQINPNVRIVLYLHEPRTTQRMVYGWKRAFLLIIFESLTRNMANMSDAVILPSQNAYEVFQRFFKKFRGSSRIIPLPFVDEPCLEQIERRYVSLVGHIGNAHQKGVDLFCEMVEESLKRPGTFAFQLVTGENPGPLLETLSEKARMNLHVVHKAKLSDEEISRAIRESTAVILLQRRVMQSGVLPVAFMNGTPIIASDLLGFTQYINDGETGCILPVDSTLDQRFDAISRIQKDLEKMSSECRRVYEKNFDSQIVVNSVPWILGAHEDTV